jgi:hypothetical protein
MKMATEKQHLRVFVGKRHNGQGPSEMGDSCSKTGVDEGNDTSTETRERKRDREKESAEKYGLGDEERGREGGRGTERELMSYKTGMHMTTSRNRWFRSSVVASENQCQTSGVSERYVRPGP